jgi:hypothetical protein
MYYNKLILLYTYILFFRNFQNIYVNLHYNHLLTREPIIIEIRDNMITPTSTYLHKYKK